MAPSTPSRSAPWRRGLRMLLLALGSAFALGCESDSLKPGTIPPDQLYWELALNHRAVLLSTTAPYDTLTLVATPLNAAGQPLAGRPAPTYTSTDFDRVRVTPGGVLHALAPTTGPIWVRVTLADSLTHRDSVLVRVVADTLPKLVSFAAEPLPPDSAKSGDTKAQTGNFMGRAPVLPVRALDAADQPLSGLPVVFRSSDPTIARIHATTGAIEPLRFGAVTFYASTTVFGVVKADTVPYHIGLPVVSVVRFRRIGPTAPLTFSPSEIRVGTGAVVLWQPGEGIPAGGEETDVTFAAADLPKITQGIGSPLYIAESFSPPTAGSTLWYYCYNDPFFGNLFGFAFDCTTGGNALIPKLDPTTPGSAPPAPGAMRMFTAPGTYEYQSTIHGAHGRIVVVDES